MRHALFLTHSPPRPSISGDRIRTFHLMRQLRLRGWRVSLFSLVPPDEPGGVDAAVASAADEWELFPRGVGPLRRAARLALGYVLRHPFQPQWFWSAAAARRCGVWLDRFPGAALVVEQLYMYPFVPASLRSRLVLDTQNVETARIAAMAHSDSSLLRRIIAASQISPVRAYERAAVASAAGVLAVSAEERADLERLAPGRVHLVPNGVDVAAIAPRDPLAPSTAQLLYLGSMSYAPNVDAVTHFVDDIAPLVRSPGVSLAVVGSNPSPSVRRAALRSPIPTFASGYVDDVSACYHESRAMIVPMRHGGGTRLKILEALAFGLPVITTRAGCAGLGLERADVALIADSPPDFAAAIDRLAADDRLWADLSAAGRRFVEEHFDWRVIGERMHQAMLGVVADR